MATAMKKEQDENKVSESRQQANQNSQPPATEEDPHIEIDEDNDEGSDPEDKFNQAHSQRQAIRRRMMNRPQGHYAGYADGAKVKKRAAVPAENYSASNSLFNLTNGAIDQANKDAKQAYAQLAHPQGLLQRKERQIQSAHPQNDGWFRTAARQAKARLYSGKPNDSAYQVKFQSTDPEMVLRTHNAKHFRSSKAPSQQAFTDQMSVQNQHQRAPTNEWYAPFSGSVTNFSHGGQFQQSPENQGKGASRGRIYTNRRQLKQIYGPRMVMTKKQLAMNMGKIYSNASRVPRVSNLSRGEKSRSNSKDKERTKAAMALKKQRSKQSLSPIQKVDQYLAELQRDDRTTPLRNAKMLPEQERSQNNGRTKSGDILYKRLRRRTVQSAKLSGIIAKQERNYPNELNQVDITVPVSAAGNNANDAKSRASGSMDKKMKAGSALGQSMKTMQSSEDPQELADENMSLHVRIRKLNATVHGLENQIQRLLKLQVGSPEVQSALSKENFDIMMSFKRSCQAQRTENQRLLEQISFLKKSKKLTTLHEQAIELNELTQYSQRQAQIIQKMQQRIKEIEAQKEKAPKVEPSVQTLKQHINDYQLILGKEENKIHELQNLLHKERTKNKELMAQLWDQKKQVGELSERLKENSTEERQEERGPNIQEAKASERTEPVSKRAAVADAATSMDNLDNVNDQEALQALQEELKKKDEEIQLCLARESDTKKELDRIREESKDKISQLEGQITKLSSENEKYQQELSSKIEEQVSRLQEQNNSSQFGQLMEQITQLVQGAAKDDNVTQLKLVQLLSNLQEQFEEQQKSSQQQQNVEAANQLKVEPERPSVHRSQASSINMIEPNGSAASLQEQPNVQELRNMISSLQQKLSEIEQIKDAKIATLEQELKEQRDKSYKLGQQMSDIKKMNEQIQLLYSNIGQTKVQMASSGCQTDGLGAGPAAREGEPNDSKATVAEQQQLQSQIEAIDQLKKELVAKDQTIQSLKTNIASLMKAIENHQSDLQRQKEELTKQFKVQAESLEADKNELKLEVQELQANQAKTLSDQENNKTIEQKDQKIDQLNALIRQTGEQVQIIREDLARTKESNEKQLQLQHQELTQKYKSNLLDLQKKYQDKVEEMQKIIDKLQNEKSQNMSPNMEIREQQSEVIYQSRDSKMKVDQSILSTPGFGSNESNANNKSILTGQDQNSKESVRIIAQERVVEEKATITDKSVHFEKEESASQRRKLTEELLLKEKQLDLMSSENEKLILQGQAFEERALELEQAHQVSLEKIEERDQEIKNLKDCLNEKLEEIKELKFHEQELVRYAEELQDKLQALRMSTPSLGNITFDNAKDFVAEEEDAKDHLKLFGNAKGQDSGQQLGRDSSKSLATFQASTHDLLKNQQVQQQEQSALADEVQHEARKSLPNDGLTQATIELRDDSSQEKLFDTKEGKPNQADQTIEGNTARVQKSKSNQEIDTIKYSAGQAGSTLEVRRDNDQFILSKQDLTQENQQNQRKIIELEEKLSQLQESMNQKQASYDNLEDQMKKVQSERDKYKQEQENIYRNSKMTINKLNEEVAALRGNRRPVRDSHSPDSSTTEGAPPRKTTQTSKPQTPPLASSNKKLTPPAHDKSKQRKINGVLYKEVEVEEYSYYEGDVTSPGPEETDKMAAGRGGDNQKLEDIAAGAGSGPQLPDLDHNRDVDERPHSPTSVKNISGPPN